MQKRSAKLDAADRKEAILVAAAPVFARLGRSGATTKDIAKAAGVSEALLYKHFAGKEALYESLESHCVEAQVVGIRILEHGSPSTATLVKGVAILVEAVFAGIGDQQSHENTKRLVTASLLGDGRLAKAFLDRHVKPWVEVFEKSLHAAKVAGDMDDEIESGITEIWFVHHLAHTLHLISLPDVGVVDYGTSRQELVQSAVCFLLRGLGLKSGAIKRYYKPQELKCLFDQTNQM